MQALNYMRLLQAIFISSFLVSAFASSVVATPPFSDFDSIPSGDAHVAELRAMVTGVERMMERSDGRTDVEVIARFVCM